MSKLLLATLIACAAPKPVRFDWQPASMLSSAALSLLHVTGDGICESAWIRPAVSCRRLYVARYSGCRWRCVSILDVASEAQQ